MWKIKKIMLLEMKIKKNNVVGGCFLKNMDGVR